MLWPEFVFQNIKQPCCAYLYLHISASLYEFSPSLPNQFLPTSLRSYTFAWSTFATSISKSYSSTCLSGAFQLDAGQNHCSSLLWSTMFFWDASFGMWVGWWVFLPHCSYCHGSYLNCCLHDCSLHLFQICYFSSIQILSAFRVWPLSCFCLLSSASICLV